MTKTHTYRGYMIERGHYLGTPDDRLKRWYYYAGDAARARAFLGRGCATLADARASIDEQIAMRATMVQG